MNPVRTLARPLLASVFVAEGIDQVRHAEALAPLAEPVIDRVVEAAQPVVDVDRPDSPELLTRLSGGVMVGAGALLALGKLPRLAAAALAATLVPRTLATHRFWEVEDEADRAAHQAHFLKDVALLGGLALAALDTEGRPSVAWRAGRRVDAVRATVADALPG